MKTTTILLYLDENYDGHLIAFPAPPYRQPWNEARAALADLIGLHPINTPGVDVKDDLLRFEDRLASVAARAKATVEKIAPLTFRITRKTPETRGTYEFPGNAFSGMDQTKWGPVDFYDDSRESIRLAFRSGDDFETPWMGCKKEILSSRITREGNKITVEVSVSDDFDTPGMGEGSFTVNRATTEDQFFAKLEDAASEAHEAATGDRNDNAGYAGFSVGKEGKWEFTYLVCLDGSDAPSGDNYYRWGWQEVEEEQEESEDAFPEELGQETARELEKQMHACLFDGGPEPLVNGYTAKLWDR